MFRRRNRCGLPLKPALLTSDCGYFPPRHPTQNYDMLGDTATVRETLAALRDTGIHVSDVEIVRLTPDFALDAQLHLFMQTAERLGAKTGAGRRQR
ncbi:Uncharacterised protein [Raoultella terrigena]|nr:Uncharacterised protein [Raoultella terrigena]